MWMSERDFSGSYWLSSCYSTGVMKDIARLADRYCPGRITIRPFHYVEPAITRSWPLNGEAVSAISTRKAPTLTKDDVEAETP